MLALDTETTGLDLWHGCRPFLVSMCDDQGRITCYEWDVNPLTRKPRIPAEDRRAIKQKLDREDLVFHNGKFDIRGLDFIKCLPSRFHWRVNDTLIASHVLASSESHKLKDLALQLLDIGDEDQKELQDATNEARRYGRREGWRIATAKDPHFPAVKRFGKDEKSAWRYDTWLPRAVAKAEDYPRKHPFWTVCRRYAVRDAERTMGIWFVLWEALQEEGLTKVYETRRKLLPITYKTETQGVTAKISGLTKARKKYTAIAERSEILCHRLAPEPIENLASNQQLQTVLFEDFQLEPVRETKTGYSTDADTLRALQLTVSTKSQPFQFIKHLTNTRKRKTALNYLSEYQASGIPVAEFDNGDWITLHSNFNITGTATTRFSSHAPNTQNISKQEKANLREIFGPLPGREWWSLDYDNIEFRIFGYESGDQALIKAFEAGLSMHLVISEILHPKRFAKLGPEAFKKTEFYRWVKNGNFALIYGASPAKADATYRVAGACKIIRKQLPKIDGFIRKKYKEGQKHGYITTLGGYRLQVPRREPHKAANYFVQGSAGWAMIKAMIRVDRYLQALPPDYHLIMTIHDELVFDFPQRKGNAAIARKICKLMETSGRDIGLPTPVDIQRIRTNWASGVSIAA